MSNMTLKALHNKLDAIQILYDETSKTNTTYNNRPLPESKAYKELNDGLQSTSGTWIDTKHYLNIVFDQTTAFFVSAADHMLALKKILMPSASSLAPWTCLRVVLESSTWICWLLDPKENVQKRISRSFACRYEDLVQQRAFTSLDTEKAKVDRHIGNLEQEAGKFGFLPIMNSGQKGQQPKRGGLGERRPDLTILVRDILQEEENYRRTSAIIHSNTTAIKELGFQRTNDAPIPVDGTVITTFEQGLSADMITELCNVAVLSFAKASWFKWEFYGWDQVHLGTTLDKVADMLQIDTIKRIWKLSTS